MSQAGYTWSNFHHAMHLSKLCKLFDMRIYLISIWMGLPFRWLTCAGLINAQLIRLQSVDGPDAANIHHWMQTPRQRSHSLIVNCSASYSNALLISKFSLSCLDAPVSLDFNLALAQWFNLFFRFSVNQVIIQVIQLIQVIQVIQVSTRHITRSTIIHIKHISDTR